LPDMDVEEVEELRRRIKLTPAAVDRLDILK
jgi:hypothetical protein